jgi:hypothetical protein
MRLLRFAAAFLLFGVSLAASAQMVPSPRFDELERKLQIRPEQKDQFDLAVGATKRALLAVGLSMMDMKQRLAEEFLKPNPDFGRFLDGADRAFDEHAPLFKEAGTEWKRLYALLDAKQVEIVKRFLLDNLGMLGAQPFLEEQPRKKQKKDAPSSVEWI